MSGAIDGLAALRPWVLGVATRLQWLPPTLARVCIGWLFMMTGWGKLHNLPDLVSFFRDLGIPVPEVQAPFAAGTEFVCGILILAGLATRVASVPLIVVMTVAIVTARREDLDGIPDLFGFVEYLYILILLYLGAYGPGPLSLDRWLVTRMGGQRRG